MAALRLALAALLLAPGLARAAKDVTVVTDMTAEGRRALPPTPAHPVYYVPTVRGYQVIGPAISGEQAPSPHDVVRAAALELARQGYLVVDDAHPRPDLLLDFAWGYLNRIGDSDFNQGQAFSLVLGQTISSVFLPESVGHQAFMDAAKDTRYFVILTAYDYDAYADRRAHIQLWQSKMSTPINGVFFDDVLVSLLRAGGPSIGRETLIRPKLAPLYPEGRVEVGEPTVKGYLPSPLK
ncbi:MAG TPA: hypothetical protein VHV47_06640 [Opitutaceae bacterium]|jgi:hypothetical protein|nr:hypothetical protein [Opitutaceae bacterium]